MHRKKHLLRGLLSTLLALCLTLSPLSAMALESGEVLTGTTGDVAWTLDLSAGVLTLSGSGATADYAGKGTADNAAPWLQYAENITTVVVEEGVTALGDRLFYGAVNLTEVVFPEKSLTSIGEGTFRQCTSLKEIILPESLTNLSRVAFLNATALESIVIGGTMTELPDQTFGGCTSLSRVTIPASVKNLLTKSGKNTFNGCAALSEITYGGTVYQWKQLLARGSADEVMVETITVTCADGTYHYDPSETLPDPDETEPDNGGDTPETLVTGTTGDITWKLDLTTGTMTLSGTGATADYASGTNAEKAAPWFDHMDAITNVVVEEGVTALGDRLFYGADSLTEVVFPEKSLTSIGNGTFRACTALEEITLPDSLEDLARVSFYSCTNLKKVVLGSEKSKLETLNDQTFYLCNSLKEITIPASLKNLLFSGAKGPLTNTPLETIHYTGTVAQWKAFLAGTTSSDVKKGTITVQCTDGIYIDGSLGSGIVYTLNGGVLTLEARLDTGDMPDFASPADLPWAAEAKSVTKVVVRSDITRIGANAFADCVNIAEVIYVGSEESWNALRENSGENNEPLFAVAVTYLSSGKCGEDVFYAYDPDTHCLTISGSGATYDYTSGSLTPWGMVRGEIEQVVVEEGVTGLGDYLFNKAYSLTRLTLPEGLREIGTFTFSQCSALTELELPEGVELIGSKAFSNATNLEKLSLPGTVRYIDMKAFEGASALKNIYYNGTQGSWDQIVISTSAQGNTPLFKAELHCLKSARTYTDVAADGPYLSAVTYLTDGGYLTIEGETFGVSGTADTDMVLEALYERASVLEAYPGAREWALDSGLTAEKKNRPLTLSSLAQLLYNTAVYNDTVTEEMDALTWCAPYFTGLDTADAGRELTRGETALVLAAYLQSDVSTAERSEALLETLRTALDGGDGQMHIYVPDMTTVNAASKPGDCTLLVFPDGKTMLIDSGINTSESIVVGMLEALGITNLDYFVLSHPHTDHVGNAVAVVEYLQGKGGGIGTMYDSGYDYKSYTQKVYDALNASTVVEHLEDGDTFTVGEVCVEIFNPVPELIEALNQVASPGDEIVNNISLTMKFTYGESTYLTAGDLYTSRELQLLEKHGSALQADVMKADHHGAYTSNSESWLDTVAPRIVFVESDDIGSTPLARLCAEQDIAFFAFGLDGSILISMDDGQNYAVTTQKGVGLTVEAEETEDPDDNGDDEDSGHTSSVSKPAIRPAQSSSKKCDGGTDCLLDAYTDVSAAQWYHEAVEYVVDNQLMTGVSASEFAPDATLTRAMAVQILWARAGKPAVNCVMTFEDVAQNAWYAEAVRWAAAEGIISGYSEKTFGPDDAVTREQLMTILYACAVKETAAADTAAGLDYVDSDTVSPWAYAASCWCTEQEIVSGRPGGVLDPAGTAKRAEAAQMLMKFCEKLAK